MNDDSSSRKPRDSGADDSGSLMSLLKRLIPGSRRGGDDAVREALEELIEDDDAEAIDSHERLLLGNILRLRDTTAYDIMIPRADIFAIDVSTPLADVAEQVGRTGHSRVPVFRETLDDVVGMILIKDLLPVIARGQTMDLRHLMRKVMFVSPAIRVLDLLVEMRLKRTHMALVVDEYGGIDGLVTIEDLVEQIVGEIEDEHDDDSEPEMLLTGDGTLTADARVALEDFEDRFGVVFSDEDKEDTDTLGGLVFRLAGRVPLRGELITHASGLEFEVVDADPRHIRRLRVRNLPQSPATVEGA
ncbi:hemolysin family protein [Novispirillum itersonii]|uniref:hemolysin family protein n=1 Tax=Novispirillum itersonii TaxID=189 RepID=UPI000476D7E3|nr:hemolysin family protein [Novispirillum itersonii]